MRKYIYTICFVLIIVSWRVSFHSYHGWNIPIGKYSNLGTSTVQGRILIGKTFDPERKNFDFGFHSQSAGEFNELLFNANSIGLKVPYSSEWPYFSAKKVVSGVRKWERVSVTFPHWFLLLILGCFVSWDVYKYFAKKRSLKKNGDL